MGSAASNGNVLCVAVDAPRQHRRGVAAPRQIIRQRDFSGGEIVEHAKRRDDEAIVRSACRTLRNVRILASGAAEARPGRSVIYQHTGRSERVAMSSTYQADFCFGNSTLTIRNAAGTPVAQGWGYAWTAATSDDVTFDRFGNDIVMTFEGQAPKIARWDGGTEWSLLEWTAAVTSGGQKRVPFYRIAPKDITLLPSGRTGGINITFSENFLQPGHVGARLRFVNRQLTISTVTNGTTGTALVNEPLPGSQVLTHSSIDPRNLFAAGEIVEGSDTGARGYVTATSATTITVQLVTTTTTVSGGVQDEGDAGGGGGSFVGTAAFTTSDSVVGPGGALTFTSVAAVGDPVAVPIWDEEVMNNFRGWPRSCAYDQGRLIFTDFPAVPEGIAYSALLGPEDMYPGPNPTDAMFETAPKKARVYHVMEGSDQFVITDRGIYYIPISEANPLKPGSVAFRRIPGPSGSAVRPATTSQGLVYVNNGLNRVLAIVGTGQTAMPWMIRPVSDLHSHLFSGIVCLAHDEGDGDPPDEMVYAVNGDGTVAVGRYQPGKEWVGWLKWESEGDVKWISATAGDAVFSVFYGFGWLTEVLDPDQYLDAAVSYDAIPTPLSTGAQADVMMSNEQGTLSGDMTSSGGLAAARDGTTSQAATACATKTVASNAFIFIRFGQRMRISKAIVYPSNDQGFGGSATHTVILRGYNGGNDPTSFSDGTQLGTTGAFGNTTASKTITSNDTATEYDGAIIAYTPASGGLSLHCAEIQLFTPGLTHGSGELWFMPSSTVDVMDGRRVVGTGITDANGEIAGLTDEQVGFAFDKTIEPFMPHVGPGQRAEPAGQTMQKRQLAGVAVAVQNSTGFKVQTYNPKTQTWTTTNTRAAYDEGDDTTDEPPLREEVFIAKPQGNDIDPRRRILKDEGGPLRVLEISDDIGA